MNDENGLTEEQIIAKLNDLDNLRSYLDVVNMHYDNIIKQEIPEEIRQKIEDIEVERQSTLDSAREGIQKLENFIKSEVLELGKSVKSKHITAVYSKGRRTVTVGDVMKLAEKYPEAKDIVKEGKPTVSIR